MTQNKPNTAPAMNYYSSVFQKSICDAFGCNGIHGQTAQAAQTYKYADATENSNDNYIRKYIPDVSSGWLADEEDDKVFQKVHLSKIDGGFVGLVDDDGTVYPRRPFDTMIRYGDRLTKYETDEIRGYYDVYFIGAITTKSMKPARINIPDDFPELPNDHVAYRYELIRMIGKGTFGKVYKVFDHKTKKYVALKVIVNEKRYQRQAEEEVRILKYLREHDPEDNMNVVHVQDHFIFRNQICIIFELLSVNLFELLRKTNLSGLSVGLVRGLCYSILQCLDGLYKQRIIHCDLKPENIVLRTYGKNAVKVIDFGSSCFAQECRYTYIQSRFYRAPEVILGLRYDMSIDMWSLGCILSELFTGRPLLPGENEMEQFAYMVELLGIPPATVTSRSKKCGMFVSSKGFPRYCEAVMMVGGQPMLSGGNISRGRRLGPPGSRKIENVLAASGDPLFIDFVSRCLMWDPDCRLTPPEALNHEWFRRRLPIPPFDLSGEQQLSNNNYSNPQAFLNSLMAMKHFNPMNIVSPMYASAPAVPPYFPMYPPIGYYVPTQQAQPSFGMMQPMNPFGLMSGFEGLAAPEVAPTY